MAFLRAVRQDEMPAGTVREVKLNERTIALVNVDGKFYALNNTCLHRGGPLGQGALAGGILTCPWHGWQYEVSTGRVTFNPEMSIATYPVEIRNDEVWVDVD
ncbi:MAG TPA: Rieske (2Fe-2S) protein [Patescibacteria group bacterium]|nr:Rieske (2Fe-2S) protein [Patescibacteria group bacterium]